jgi:hypothetical protein
MRSAPLLASVKTAIRTRRAAVRSCASAIAFAYDGDGKGAEGASFFVTALAAAGFVITQNQAKDEREDYAGAQNECENKVVDFGRTGCRLREPESHPRLSLEKAKASALATAIRVMTAAARPGSARWVHVSLRR